MLITLDRFGFGESFIKWIITISPTAQVITNRIISQPFTINRNTRQGCPLPPLLFALFICQDAQITAIMTATKSVYMQTIYYYIYIYIYTKTLNITTGSISTHRKILFCLRLHHQLAQIHHPPITYIAVECNYWKTTFLTSFHMVKWNN